MYLVLMKLEEDNNKVVYRMETLIEDGHYLNYYGKEKGLWKTIYAYCIFKKQNKEILFDTKKSHPYFFTKSRTVRRGHIELIGIQMNHKRYPGFICINTGG